MSERAGRGEVRVKPHLLGPFQKPLGGPPRTSPKGLQGCQGPKPGPKPRKTGASRRLQKLPGPSGLSGAAKGTFQNPPQPLPGLTGLQGFQAKPLQTAPWDSSGALKAPPISLNKRDGYDRHAGRPTFGFARPPFRFARGDSPSLTASATPDTEASQQVTAGSGRIKHGGPAKGRASATTHS